MGWHRTKYGLGDKPTAELKIMQGRWLILVFCALTPTPIFAFGNDNVWQSGWGQGISEAIITKGPGNQIYVTCGEHYGRSGQTAISFMLRGDSPKGSSITLTFDGEDPQDYSLWDGRIPSDCRACESNYNVVVEKLRQHNTVHVRFENGDAAKFTLRGAAKAIVACKPDFAVY